MSINWHIIHWPDLAAFERHLKTLPRPAWVRGLTTHHTARPRIDEWRGYQSMLALGRHYELTNKWSAGPQLFVATDGLWQGTPLTDWGVHAGNCNDYRLGIEVLGDYSAGVWQEPIRSLALGAHALLLEWLGLDVSAYTVVGHRDCMPGKTSCPGNAISMPAVRADIAAVMEARRAAADNNPQVLALPPGPLPLDEPRFLASLEAHAAHERGLPAGAQGYIYRECERLRVHPGFLLGLLYLETRYGRSGAGPYNNWLNARALDSREWRVQIGEIWYERWGVPEPQIIARLNEFAGRYAYQNKVRLREVLTQWLSPHAQDGDSVERAAAQILETMRYIAARTPKVA